ncbi:MAG: RDD family protein [Aeoliella sp.]
MHDPTNPYASPQTYSTTTEVAIDSPDGPLELAGRGTRFVASLLDGVIMMFVFFPIYFYLAYTFYPGMFTLQDVVQPGMTPEQVEAAIDDSQPGIGFNLAMVVLGFVIFLLLQGFFLAKSSQTIGKKIFGIMIVRKDGGHADFGRLIGLRYLPMQIVGAIPFIGVIIVGFVDPLLIFRRSRSCLHDDIADTAVVFG